MSFSAFFGTSHIVYLVLLGVVKLFCNFTLGLGCLTIVDSFIFLGFLGSIHPIFHANSRDYG